MVFLFILEWRLKYFNIRLIENAVNDNEFINLLLNKVKKFRYFTTHIYSLGQTKIMLSSWFRKHDQAWS
jgi:hypothetical protein